MLLAQFWDFLEESSLHLMKEWEKANECAHFLKAEWVSHKESHISSSQKY